MQVLPSHSAFYHGCRLLQAPYFEQRIAIRQAGDKDKPMVFQLFQDAGAGESSHPGSVSHLRHLMPQSCSKYLLSSGASAARSLAG